MQGSLAIPDTAVAKMLLGEPDTALALFKEAEEGAQARCY